ncbi:unnamed protein product, partial [Rotaria socialis]
DVGPCRHGGHCKVTVETRKCCTSCRLVKCLAVGKSPKLIRKEYRRLECPSSVGANSKSISISRTNSLDLLHNDRSSLDNSEWNLLSIVIHAFDKFNLVPAMRRIINYLDFIEPTLEIDVSDTFNLFASFYTSVQSFVSVTTDFYVLAAAEQRSLFQRNLHGLFNICGSFMLRDAGMFDNSRHESIIAPFKAILRFAPLVKHMLDLLALSADICRDNRLHRLLVDDLVEQAKETLSINEKDFVPLWGKTINASVNKNNDLQNY